MQDRPSYQELLQTIDLLEQKNRELARSERLNQTLLTISKAVNVISSPYQFFQKVHSALNPVIDTANFFIALYDETKDSLVFPYRVNAVHHSYPPAVQVSKTGSLAAEVIRTGAPLFVTKEDVLEFRSRSKLITPAFTPPEIWLGVPLQYKGKMVGVMSVQSYDDPHCYDETDLTLMIAVAELVATAIENLHVEESLRVSETKFRELYNFSVGGILLGTNEGVIIGANEQMCEIAGTRQEDLIGRHVSELPFTKKSMARNPFRFDLLEQGSKVVTERVLVRPDGTEINVEMQTKMMHDGSYQSIFSDITERKIRDKALQEAEERFRLAFITSPDSININKMDGTYVDINLGFTEMTGYSRDDVIGKSSLEMNIWNNPEDRKCLVEGLQRDGQVRSLEAEFVMKDGSIKIGLMSANIIELSGEPHILSVAKDISLLKKTEQERHELELKYMQSQKMEAIGTMAGGIAHDFNNMLAVIIGNAEMALLDIPDGNPAKYSAEQIVSASQRVKKLIEQILTFSHKTDQKLLPIRLYPIVEESLQLLRSTIPTTVRIVHSFDTGSNTIMGDPTQIHQLLMNLCTNGVHAMDEKGLLEITGTTVHFEADEPGHPSDLQPGNYIRIKVRDTGSGIPREIQQRMFDPFYTTKGLHEGTGMGLSIVLGIIKSHDGSIQVESQPGEGTTFFMYFPAINNVDEEGEEESLENFSSRGERILFVDDVEMLAEIGGSMLSRLGYDVTVKTGSIEALEMFKAAPAAFDLVITDQSMPEMSGAELSAELLAIRPDLPIILCTGYSRKINEQNAMKLGVRKYLIKPYGINQLSKMIKEVIE